MGAVCVGVEKKITKSNEEFGKEFVFEFSRSDFSVFSCFVSCVDLGKKFLPKFRPIVLEANRHNSTAKLGFNVRMDFFFSHNNE